MVRCSRLVLLLALFALHLLVSLSLPTSGLTAGVYDDGDHDDIIAQFTEFVVSPPEFPADDWLLFRFSTAHIVTSDEPTAGEVSPVVNPPRAPPFSASTR